MDRLKNSRAPVRGTITKLINDASEELIKENPDQDILQIKLNRIVAKHTELKELDEKIKNQLLDDDAEADEITQECQTVEDYEEKIEAIRLKIEKVLHPPVVNNASPVPSETS